MANSTLTPDVAAELAKLALLSDEEIDTASEPEVADWSRARRGLFAEKSLIERAYDVRSIANWFLSWASSARVPISNMSLNKLVYLAVERALVERLVYLTPAKVEAWEHGPVFREIYQSFSSWGERPISGRAQKFSVTERAMLDATDTFDPEDEIFLRQVAERYGGKTAAQLRSISHMNGGPWHTVWHYRGKTNPGMEITPSTIFERARSEREMND